MIELTAIQAFLVAAGPALASILGICIAVITILTKFTTLIKEVKNNTDNKELREELRKAIKEEKELKQVNKKLVEKLTHVHYEDLGDD